MQAGLLLPRLPIRLNTITVILETSREELEKELYIHLFLSKYQYMPSDEHVHKRKLVTQDAPPQ